MNVLLVVGILVLCAVGSLVAFSLRDRSAAKRKTDKVLLTEDPETKARKKVEIETLEKEVFAKADEVKRRCDEDSGVNILEELAKDEKRPVSAADTATMKSLSRKVEEVKRLAKG